MADTPRGGIDHDEVAPPSVTAAPQPPPYSESAGEGQYTHTHVPYALHEIMTIRIKRTSIICNHGI